MTSYIPKDRGQIRAAMAQRLANLTVEEAHALYERDWAETTRGGLIHGKSGLIDVRWKSTKGQSDE